MQEFLYKLQLVRGDMLRSGPTAAEQAYSLGCVTRATNVSLA